MTIDAPILAELRETIDKGQASGDLLSAEQVAKYTGVFAERFGPAVLSSLDGEALLKLMHGRRDGEPRCLMYWLEFKNDDEFPDRFGGIGGGAASKFGVYQRNPDGAWASGAGKSIQVISITDAIAIARRQRDELVAGAGALAALSRQDTSDTAYSKLQASMQTAAPELYRSGWAHKYWFLIAPNTLDTFHSPRWQRFYLIKLRQTPPDGVGVLDGEAPRFVCAGRFLTLARELGVPVTSLASALKLRYGSLHRYWRVGTREGSTGDSRWPEMRDNSVASVGWSHLGDLTPLLVGNDTRQQIRERLLPDYPGNPGVATRKAGGLLNFTQTMAEGDIVVACDGMEVLGIGRVTGPYSYRPALNFAHVRPVEWRQFEPWRLPEGEGLQTTAFELGRIPTNLFEIERHYTGAPALVIDPPIKERILPPPSPLDTLAVRIEAALRRRGQVVLHGPPGTGKTYTALRVARELTTRAVFRSTYDNITPSQKQEIDGANGGDGLVRLCSFHPGYGYEDFVEGLRPSLANGAMVFAPQPGIFKRLCDDAAKVPGRPFYLVIDEINRGDVPRIFGELMTVLELDKRGMKVLLPLTGASLSVPPNIFLIATMNTADRSIALLDAALRRRFGFIELMPDPALLDQRQVGALLLGEWLDALNRRLRVHIPRDARSRQVGHAYLMPMPPITSVAEFGRILRDEIVPLLQEYCSDDFAILQAILGKGLINAEASTLRHALFEPNQEDDLVQAVLTGMEISGATVAAETTPEPAGEQDGPTDANSTA